MTAMPPTNAEKPTAEVANLPKLWQDQIAKLPTELSDKIIEFNILQSFPEVEAHQYQMINRDGQITEIVQKHTLYRVQVDENGQCSLFEERLLQQEGFKTSVTEVLRALLPVMIFQIESPAALTSYLTCLSAYFDNLPAVQIEVRPIVALESDAQFCKWSTLISAHGFKEKVPDKVEEWNKALAKLPDGSKIYLSFGVFWRDFRALRGGLLRYELSAKVAGCYFEPKLKDFPEYDFLIKETLSAATDTEIPQWPSTDARRMHLVDYGCRGFHWRHYPVA